MQNRPARLIRTLIGQTKELAVVVGGIGAEATNKKAGASTEYEES